MAGTAKKYSRRVFTPVVASRISGIAATRRNKVARAA
jgi:hypothetical protein